MEILPIGLGFEPKAGQASLLEESRLTSQDFLTVMVAQLRNQNPLEPQSDTDFISGIAQFDQLASLSKISESLATMTALSALGQASTLLGRSILADVGTETPLSGVVEVVEMRDGEPLLVIGDHRIPTSAVLAVS